MDCGISRVRFDLSFSVFEYAFVSLRFNIVDIDVVEFFLQIAILDSLIRGVGDSHIVNSEESTFDYENLREHEVKIGTA